MAVKEWTPEQLENAYRYGICMTCGWPREAKSMIADDGKPLWSLSCPNGHGTTLTGIALGRWTERQRMMLGGMSPEAASLATGVEFVEATFEQWSPCPVCGGPTHHELLIGSEEVVCDDPACSWDGAVIDVLDD